MVFKLFPDKESVYRAILEQRIDAMERAMPLSGLADSPETPERFFGRIAEVALGRIEEDPSFLRLVLFSALEDHPLAAEYHRARAEGAREVISAYLRRQDRAGALRCTDPDFASRAFMGLVLWFAMARTVMHDPGSRRMSGPSLVRAVVRLFLDGMRPRGVRRRR
jgi:AcrR family transcriptional regulator